MSTSDEDFMVLALDAGERARLHAPPNPWVGAVVVDSRGVIVGEGHTQAPGDSHAEVEALRRAGERARDATLYVTLEPCDHQGRTGPCTRAIADAGVARVVVALRDPDARVRGRGIAALRGAGIEVLEGIGADAAHAQLAPYLWHRTSGRPYVVAKVASTLDGVVAMADGSSQWITAVEARRDAHLLRAQSQAILVGAGTVRSDDPALTARLDDVILEPLRVVLGRAPSAARVHPCWERGGDLGAILDELGAHGVVQLMVEGGPTTLSAFVREGLVNRFVWYLAPAFAGATGARPALSDLSTPTMEELRRGRIVSIRAVGGDVRVDVEV